MKPNDLYPTTKSNLSPAARPDAGSRPIEIHIPSRLGRRSANNFWMWLILILAILYAISPIDFVPDVIPIVGWIDDIVVVLTAVSIALPKIMRR